MNKQFISGNGLRGIQERALSMQGEAKFENDHLFTMTLEVPIGPLKA